MTFSRTSTGAATSRSSCPRAFSSAFSIRRALRLWLACALIALAAGGAGVARAQSSLPVIGLDIAPSIIAENAGQQAAIGTLRRYFSDNSRPLTVKLSSGLPQTLGVPATVTIPSGQDHITFPISVTDDSELNGTRTALVTASAEGYYDTFFAASISDDEALFEMSADPSRISENGGRATVTLRRAQSSAGVAEDILLASSVPGALTLPEKVRFESGQRALTFEVVGVDNDKFDGARTVSISARRDRSGQIITADVVLIDNELDLTISAPSTIAENAGGALFATVSRTRAAAEQSSIAVSVSSSDASELLGSLGVVMAQNQTEVRVPLQAIDDLLVDGVQEVTLTATASGYNSDAQTVSVADNDTPEMLLSLNTASASESSEPAAATGTLRRNTPTTSEVTVALRSSLPRVVVPPSVTMARGAVEVRFPIRVVDNAVRDGNANVSISASAAGFPARSATLLVLDNDGPSLQIEISPSQVLEGLSKADSPAAVGVITRLNAPLGQALSVTISSSDKNVALLAKMPAPVASPTPAPSPTQVPDPNAPAVPEGSQALTLTIPAGQSSVRFVLLTPDDSIPTDLRTATISAVASGLNQAAVAVDVRDNDDRAELRVGMEALIASTDTDKGAQDPKFDGPRVDENAGPTAIRATVSRNTATTSEVIVQISTTGDITAPPFVVIPFGRSSVSFYVTPVDDNRRCDEDADVISSITPSVAGYTFVPEPVPNTKIAQSNQVLVADNDSTEGCIRRRRVKVVIQPRVTRDPKAIGELDGSNAATIIVKRADVVSISDPEYSLGLVVDLVSSAPERAAAIPGLARNVLGKAPSKSPASPARVILLPGRDVLRQFSDGTSAAGSDGIPDHEQDGEDQYDYLLPFAQVPLSISNDMVRQGCSTITITPVVVGYVRPGDLSRIIPASEVGQGYKHDEIADTVGVLDAEPEISRLSVSPGVLNESGASGVATGLVRRAPGVTGALIVTVRTLNAAKIGVSPTGRRETRNTLDVTIPDGQQEASFNVIANDNTINDGDITVLLEASTKCSIAVLRTPIVVRDNDVPKLSLGLRFIGGQNHIYEGMPANTLVAMVQRSGNLSSALTVTLSSSDTTELLVPSTITIPAGRASVTFAPRVVDDAILDGVQKVTISARAAAAITGQLSLTVADNEKAAPKK